MTPFSSEKVLPVSHDEKPSMSILTSDECYGLLGTREIGRLGVLAEQYPLIIPMNYAMDEGIIVVRSRPGLKLSSAQHANVTFQVDDINERTRGGWSVLVRGQAEEVSTDHSPEIIDRTEQTNLKPWAPGADFHWVRIIPHGISGRRISPGLDRQWEFGTAAYM